MNIEGFRRMSDIAEEPTEWFWGGRIPIGELTILEGDPGSNKTSLAYDLSARATRGDDMPCVPPKRGRKRKAGVLFLIAEDSLSKTVRARLVAAGADLSKIAVLDNASIPDDLLRIEKAVHEIDAKLVVVDTLNDFFSCNVLGNQAVRKALRALRELAARLHVAVLLIRHFTKSTNGHSLLRGGGSAGITALCRSQLKLYKHPADPNLRVVPQDKSNLGPTSPSLMFEVVPDDSGSFRLKWHGECDLTVEELERQHKGSPKSEAAEKFLLEKLADGPKDVNSLIDQANGTCSKRTLDETKKRMELKTQRKGKGRNHKVYWSL